MHNNHKKSLKNKINEAISSFQKISNISNEIMQSAQICIKSINDNKKIIFCGNGGSAADSQHLAAELIGKFLKKRKALPALALNTNSSIITSIGNDINFESIFSRQIEALGNKNDVLFAITTSGKSRNILNAIKVAKKKGLKIILLTSINCKIKSGKNFFVIKAPTKRVDRIQEMHITIGHLICEYIENNFKN
jgi:D-sedoheptulose 7-phosphate isomerase